MVAIVTIFANVCHDAIKVESVPVTMIVPQLPAGSDPMLKVVVGIVMLAGTIRSVMTVLLAGLPQLFPYMIV